MLNKNGKEIKLKMIDFRKASGIYLILILKILFKSGRKMTRGQISDEIEKEIGHNPYRERKGRLHDIFIHLHQYDLITQDSIPNRKKQNRKIFNHTITSKGMEFLRILKVIK